MEKGAEALRQCKKSIELSLESRKRKCVQIQELLNVHSILLDFEAENYEKALARLAEKFAAAHPTVCRDELLKSLIERERMGSTGIGNGIALPHAKSTNINDIQGILAVSRKGIEFNALDGELVHIIFLIVYPAGDTGERLKVLASVASFLRDKYSRESILKSRTPEQALLFILARESQ